MVIPIVVGIFSQSVHTLETVFKALLSTKPWLRDSEVLPISYQWDKLPTDDPLTFGMFAFDHIATPHPPLERAMRYVAKALAADRHEVSELLSLGHTLTLVALALAPTITYNSKTSPCKSHCPNCYCKSLTLAQPLITGANARVDISERIALSGEPYVLEIEGLFSDNSPGPMPLMDFYKYTTHVQQYRSHYAAYWNSRSKDTSTSIRSDADLESMLLELTNVCRTAGGRCCDACQPKCRPDPRENVSWESVLAPVSMQHCSELTYISLYKCPECTRLLLRCHTSDNGG
jgi:amidase